MKPNFSARNGARDMAATKIQRQWRKYQEDRKRKETADENQNIYKMSEEVYHHRNNITFYLKIYFQNWLYTLFK